MPEGVQLHGRLVLPQLAAPGLIELPENHLQAEKHRDQMAAWLPHKPALRPGPTRAEGCGSWSGSPVARFSSSPNPPSGLILRLLHPCRAEAVAQWTWRGDHKVGVWFVPGTCVQLPRGQGWCPRHTCCFSLWHTQPWQLGETTRSSDGGARPEGLWVPLGSRCHQGPLSEEDRGLLLGGAEGLSSEPVKSLQVGFPSDLRAPCR